MNLQQIQTVHSNIIIAINNHLENNTEFYYSFEHVDNKLTNTFWTILTEFVINIY